MTISGTATGTRAARRPGQAGSAGERRRNTPTMPATPATMPAAIRNAGALTFRASSRASLTTAASSTTSEPAPPPSAAIVARSRREPAGTPRATQRRAERSHQGEQPERGRRRHRRRSRRRAVRPRRWRSCATARRGRAADRPSSSRRRGTRRPARDQARRTPRLRRRRSARVTARLAMHSARAPMAGAEGGQFRLGAGDEPQPGQRLRRRTPYPPPRGTDEPRTTEPHGPACWLTHRTWRAEQTRLGSGRSRSLPSVSARSCDSSPDAAVSARPYADQWSGIAGQCPSSSSRRVAR